MSGIERRTSCDPRLMSCQDIETKETKETKKEEPISRDERVPPAAARRHASEAAAVAVRAHETPKVRGGLASKDVSSMPDAVLDHQAGALRTRLRNGEYAGREVDVAELAAIESEVGKRDAAKKGAAREAHGGVKLCKRTADLPGSGIHGAQHWWLQTTTKEAGMGPATGNVPGHGELLPESFATKLIDHSQEPKDDCTPVIADEDCVDRELEIGQSTGTWIPGINDCHTVVKNIVAKCREESIVKALDEEQKRDAGARQ